MHIENKSLDSLVELVTEKTLRKSANLPYIGLEHIAQGVPSLLGTATSDNSVSVNSVFKQNDILFGKLRPNLKKCVQVKFKGYCSTDILVLRPRINVVPGFAAQVLQQDAVFAEAVRTAEGTKMPRTSWDKLKNFCVFAPHPTEQHRIAEILDTVDAVIQKADALITKLRQVRAGLIDDLLMYGVNEQGVLRNPVSPSYHGIDPEVGRAPKDWEIYQLKKLAEVTVGFVGPTEQHYCDSDNGVLFLRTGNITERGLDLTDVRYVTQSFHKMARKSALKGGDVVVSRVGYTGTPTLIPNGLGEVNCANMIIIRCDGQKIKPEFLSLLFSGEGFNRQIRGFTAGSAQPVFNISLVERLLTPCPTIQEQERITMIVSSHDARIRSEEVSRDKLKVIKRGLMQDLLTGRVRVSVPASPNGTPQ